MQEKPVLHLVVDSSVLIKQAPIKVIFISNIFINITFFQPKKGYY
jgi:hypothetical protein